MKDMNGQVKYFKSIVSNSSTYFCREHVKTVTDGPRRNLPTAVNFETMIRENTLSYFQNWQHWTFA